MRNLRIVQDVTEIVDSHLPLTALAWDAKNDAVIFTLGPSAPYDTIELRRAFSTSHGSGEGCELIAAWEAPCPLPDLPVDSVVDLHCFPEDGTACLVLAGGDLIQVREEPLEGQAKIEIVGSVDGGIAAACWSPDEELLTVATCSDTLLFMTVDFDNVASVPLSDQDAKLSKHVSVGWGKSETQFKGKRAKSLRDPTMPEKVDEGTISAFDQQEVNISWRGDGSYVALNSIIADGPRRMIRIFNREGLLDSVTEPVNGLEGALSWRPAGNLIAGVQRIEQEINVIFFERNGLKHGSFPLRVDPKDEEQWASPISLDWNVVSSVLAVSFRDKIQLWTMGNYHYYLKQEIRHLQGQDGSGMRWHPEDPLRISTFTSLIGSLQANGIHTEGESFAPPKNILRNLELTFTVSSGPPVPPSDIGMVAVIDGNSLKVTPLRTANIPPPMALHEVHVEKIKDVAINSSSTLIAALHEESLSVIQVYEKSHSQVPIVIKIAPIPKTDTQTTRQICFRGEQQIFVLLNDYLTNAMSIYDHNSSQTYNGPSKAGPSHLNPSVNHESLHLQHGSTINELQFPLGIENDARLDQVAKPICQFPSNANISKAEVLRRGEGDIVLGLTANGSLFANERLLVKNCTSFLVTQAHVIFTTANHLLKFVHITDVPDLEVPPDEPEIDERCRSIERGARLVAVLPTTFSLILQMPRGNLETIYPRALVLASIRNNIDARRYRKAFLTCRSQRVDMNILHDYAPTQFLADVERFVDQLKEVEYIDLFLSQLRDEDVSQTMYRQTLPQVDSASDKPRMGALGQASSTSSMSKVNDICDAFLTVLRNRFSTNLQNVITAHVCKVPPNIETGLQVISGLRENEIELTEKATEHVCFLVDVNRVYDAALGLYDLELALLVAQQSQKDPREYLPYLQTLKDLPSLRKQFKIDDDLGRHGKALGHLKALNDFEAFQSYTQKHGLFIEALELYRYEPEATKALTRLYADYLSIQSKFKEAAQAFESLQDYTSASDAYRSANMWEECLSCATLARQPPEQITSLAQSIAEHLSSTKEFHACAIVHLDYLEDLSGAILNYCKAHRFATAVRLASMHQRFELLEEVVDPGLVEASATITELLADCKAQVNAQVPRLRELRKTKAANPLAFLTGDGPDGVNGSGDIPDDISLAPSATSTAGASLFTRYTQRSGLTNTVATGTTRKTSKNRRREERKRARGKKGSVYEEEYLVNSIGRLIERVNETADDVRSTVDGLLRRNMRERARAVEEAMVEVVGICEAAVGEVYEVPTEQAPVVDESGGGSRPMGGDGVLWDSLEESKAARVVPVVRAYQRSALMA